VKVESYLQRLEAEQARLACESLEKPAGKDAFEYGRAAGIYAGLEHAKRVLMDMFAEKERRDFDI
jgi:hypothetical protein